MLKRYINEKNAFKLQLLKVEILSRNLKTLKKERRILLRKYFREFSIAPLILTNYCKNKIRFS